MSESSTTRPLSEFVDDGSVTMLTTGTSMTNASARPMTVAGATDSTIRYLIDASAEWAAALTDGESVLVTLTDSRSNSYVALRGRASITDDAARIDALWSASAAAFFDDGRSDPNIAVLEVEVDDGEYWDSPSGRLGALFTVVKAAVTDDAGEHGSLDV